MTVQAPRYCQLSCLLLSLILGYGDRLVAFEPVAPAKGVSEPIVAQSESTRAAILQGRRYANAPLPDLPVPTPATVAPDHPSLPELAQREPELERSERATPQPELDLGEETQPALEPLRLGTPAPETLASPADAAAPNPPVPDPVVPSEALSSEEDTGAMESTESTESTDLMDPELQQTGDPELGILRLRERPLQKPTQPKFVFLTGSFSYFRSDNILSSEIDTIGDQLMGGRLILSARPAIGPRTLLLGAIEGNLIRYGDLSDLDYNGFGLKAGVRHFWSRQAYSEFSWDNRQLFLSRDGDRFLNDHSLRLSMFYRVPLAAQLKLDNYYQFRWSVADPTDRSRLVNRFGTVLNYDLTPTLQLGLNYQYDLTHFTQRDREDSYHQILAQLSWDLSQSIRLNFYGGYSFGASTDSDVNFNGSILGAGVSFNLPLF